jgi:hypothetical protein
MLVSNAILVDGFRLQVIKSLLPNIRATMLPAIVALGPDAFSRIGVAASKLLDDLICVQGLFGAFIKLLIEASNLGGSLSDSISSYIGVVWSKVRRLAPAFAQYAIRLC